MAAGKQEDESEIPGELASNIVKLSEFLDPHLKNASVRGKAAKPDRWPRRRAALFVLCASLILWAALFASLHYAHRFFALLWSG